MVFYAQSTVTVISGGERETERDRERQRETERQRDRDTERERQRHRENSNSNSKTLILKDSSVRSVWTYLTDSPCYTTDTNKHDFATNRYYKHE